MSIVICESCEQGFVGGRGCDSHITLVHEADAFYLFIGEKSEYARPIGPHKIPLLFRVKPAPMKEVFMPYKEVGALCDACVGGYGMVGMLEPGEWCKKCGGCGSVSVPGQLHDTMCPSCRGTRVELP